LYGTSVNDFALVGDFAYILADVTLRCRASDCDTTLERVQLEAPAGAAGFSPGNQIVADEGYLYATSYDQRIIRFPQDGGTFEEVAMAGSDGLIANIAVHGENVYWLESEYSSNYDAPGRVLSCPKTGCQGEPKLVVDNLVKPIDLVVDDTFVYFTEPRYLCQSCSDTSTEPDGPDRLSRCSIEGCASPTVLVENAGLGFELNGQCTAATPHLVMDDSYVYFATCDTTLPGPTTWDAPAPAVYGCGIAAMAKSRH
jgi:hypothetical protein